MSNVRSIVYIWWRKSEIKDGFIKFGDHIEPLENKDWIKSTERYIQKTAAPKESKIFKDIIDFKIFDATDYAKRVNKNKKFARVDNTITKVAGLDKYRLGQTDQFKLPKFEIDVDEFIEKVKDVIYGKNSDYHIPVTNDFTIADIKDLQLNKVKEFNFPIITKELDILSLINFLDSSNILILSKSQDYDNLIKKYFEFNNYIVKHDGIEDGQYKFADKKIMICNSVNINQNGYDFIFNDFENKVYIN